MFVASYVEIDNFFEEHVVPNTVLPGELDLIKKVIMHVMLLVVREFMVVFDYANVFLLELLGEGERLRLVVFLCLFRILEFVGVLIFRLVKERLHL